MSDILRQVDEDLRKDRLLKIWTSYRIYIVGSILILLISLAGYQYYLFNTHSKNEAIVEKYVNALSEENINNSINQLVELDESKNTFMRGLAKLKRAELYFTNNDEDSALKLLEIIYNDKSLGKLTRDLALYKYLMVQLDFLDKDLYFKMIDSNDLEESKFKYHFKELKGLKLLIEGDRSNGIEIFESIIADEGSPIEIRTRSEKFIEISKL